MENKATKINRQLKEAAATAARLAQEWSRSRREWQEEGADAGSPCANSLTNSQFVCPNLFA